MITEISKQMKFALTESAEQAALTTGLVERQVKVTGANLCQTLVMGWWQDPNQSMEGLAQMAHSVGLQISAQGLDQRLNEKTASCLRELLRIIVTVKLKTKQQTLPSMKPFTHVYLEDSSIVTLDETLEKVWRGVGGSSSQSSVKLQTRLDMKQGHLDGPHLCDGRLHDNQAAQYHAPVEQGALHIRDLGYWSLDGWARAEQDDYFILSRMKTSTHFWFEGACYDCFNWCQLQENEQFDVPVLLGKTRKIPVRFVGRKLSATKAADKRRKLKRAAQKRGDTVSEARLALCDWVLMVTNVPQTQLSLHDMLIWLGVRWQIELLFKLWKSVGEIDNSRSRKPWRQLCEFYAKLIAMTLQHWLFIPAVWHFPNRSLTKAAKAIRLHVIRIATALHSQYALRRVLKHICDTLSTGCRINRSNKQKRTFQKLQALEVLIA